MYAKKIDLNPYPIKKWIVDLSIRVKKYNFWEKNLYNFGLGKEFLATLPNA